jgi:asparagine synthase (glutamine-hydrolysing)
MLVDKKIGFHRTLARPFSAMQCYVVTCAKQSIHQDSRYFVVICGDCYIDQVKVTAGNIVKVYGQCSDDFPLLYAKLSGQFWLIFFDKRKQALFLVNDHFGILPCYYSLQNNRLCISDSLKRLKNITGLTLTISEQALFNYMFFHCIPSPNTVYKQVAKLEPGKAVVFDQAMQRREQLLYQPKFSQTLRQDQSHHDACLAEIDKAVAKYNQGDAGAFLSGGVDSSSIVGMLSRHSAKAKSFSVGFNEKDFDETPYAKLTATHFGACHHVLYLQAEQAVNAFVNVAQYFDEPFGNSSAMATYFCAKFAKSHGVNHLLAGDGGDELFAGNQRYVKQKTFEYYQQVPRPVRSLAKSMLCQSPLRKIPLLSKAASYIAQAQVPLPDRLENYNFINHLGVQNMFNDDFLSCVDIEQPLTQQRARYFACSSDNPVDRMLYLDWKFTLADNDLVKVGRMCEMAGVSVRYPLLDKAMLDFSCTIPADIKLPGNKLRHFYKQSCRGFLANETLSKSKHGFGLPFGLWMKQNKTLRELALDTLLAFKARKIISEPLIDKVLDAHQSVHASYYGELIWIMVVLELWLQQ